MKGKFEATMRNYSERKKEREREIMIGQMRVDVQLSRMSITIWSQERRK